MKQWHQFAIFSTSECSEAIETLPADSRSDKFLYVILTHSCAICRDDFKQEPVAECIVAQPIDAPNVEFENRRHRRWLDLQVNVGDEQLWFRLSIVERHFFDRKLLSDKSPAKNITLSEDNQDSLLRWVVHRYQAPAFPDEFDQAISKHIQSKISRKLKNLNHHQVILGIYFRYSLPEGDEFSAVMQFFILHGPNLSEEELEDCHALRKRIDEIFKDKKDKSLIMGRDTVVVATNRLTVENYSNLQYLDYSSLSEGDYAGKDSERPIE